MSEVEPVEIDPGDIAPCHRTTSDGVLVLDPLPDNRFSDRELSWLAFNQRVLELAEDPDLPLLARTRFLAIFASNLDEFFMVRVAGLKRRIATGIAVRAASGLMPGEVLDGLWARTRELMLRQVRCFHDELLPALAKEGIELLRWDELNDDDRAKMAAVFQDRIFPVLTPLAVDPAHPFPYISGLSLNLAVVVRNPTTGMEHFARVKVPQLLGRFAQVSSQRFVPLEDVIAAHLDELFPGMEVLQSHGFRVTRNEDLEVEEDDAENLLQALEKELMRRKFGPPVRLEVEDTIDPHVLELLVRELGIEAQEVVAHPRPARPHRPDGRRRRRPARARLPGVHPAPAPGPVRGRERRRGRHPRARSASATCCCTTRTTRSRRASRRSSSRPPPTRRSSRSSRRSTAPAVTPRSSTRSSRPPRPASRCSSSSRSRRASTSRRTSSGPASSSRPAATSSTASSG